MLNTAVYTLFGKNNKPFCTGVFNPAKSSAPQVIPLYIPGCETSVWDAEQRAKLIADSITKLATSGTKVVTSQFKQHLDHFPFPLCHRPYDIYDLNLPPLKPLDTFLKCKDAVTKILSMMVDTEIKPWHKVFANAAIAYQSLQNRGVLIGYSLQKPIWSMDTYTGRSKNTGFNAQGVSDDGFLRNPISSERDKFIHFDWMAADIRMAQILSGDQVLGEAFSTSGPYEAMEAIINEGLLPDDEGRIGRDECKLALLSAINSLDYDDPAVQIFPDLSAWMRASIEHIENNGWLASILGRKFKIGPDRDVKSVFNSVMQGSVAHAMQATVKRVWDEVDDKLLVETHDSLTITCAPELATIKHIIESVTKIMCRPFEGLLDNNPMFPVRVYIGSKFKQWKFFGIYRC